MSNLLSIQQDLSNYEAHLVAVSKTKPIEAILELYEAGQRSFGENKVQELVSKYNSLPKDINWHMIGHLQKNKVKQIAPFIFMIHSVDNFDLLEVIDKKAKDNQRIINVLLQIKIAKEENKYGFNFDELVSQFQLEKYPNINFCGVMGMATFTEDEDQIRKEFQQLVSFRQQLKNLFFSTIEGFKEISMGMSGDYKIALEEGSTIVRIGSLIFGSRNYSE